MNDYDPFSKLNRSIKDQAHPLSKKEWQVTSLMAPLVAHHFSVNKNVTDEEMEILRTWALRHVDLINKACSDSSRD